VKGNFNINSTNINLPSDCKNKLLERCVRSIVSIPQLAQNPRVAGECIGKQKGCLQRRFRRLGC